MGQGLAEPGLPPHEAAGPLLWKSHKDIEQLTQQILKGRLRRGPVGRTSFGLLVVLFGEGPWGQERPWSSRIPFQGRRSEGGL